MKRVIIESPYRASTWFGRWLNKRYARKCIRHSLMLGEAPFASHLFYTQVLNDQDPGEREWGIGAGFVWGECADLTAVYDDRGISGGMRIGIAEATRADRPVVFRTLRPKKKPAVRRASGPDWMGSLMLAC